VDRVDVERELERRHARDLAGLSSVLGLSTSTTSTGFVTNVGELGSCSTGSQTTAASA
jgi:hypothetical protein